MVGLTLNWLEEAVLVMLCHFYVVELYVAPHQVIPALKPQLLKLLLDILLAIEEPWFLALHGAHACFLMELLEALMMEPLFALLALYGVYQDCLA